MKAIPKTLPNKRHEMLAINSTNEIVQHPHIKQAMLERIYADAVGMCSKCGEYTALDNTCCGALVWYGGALVDPAQAVSDDE